MSGAGESDSIGTHLTHWNSLNSLCHWGLRTHWGRFSMSPQKLNQRLTGDGS